MTGRSKRWARRCVPIASALLAVLGATPVQAEEPGASLRLTTELRQVPTLAPSSPSTPNLHWASHADRWIPGGSDCDGQGSPPWSHLTLSAALAHTLCQSPGLRQALADVSEQAAGVELAEIEQSARFSANADYSASRNFNSSGSSGRTLGGSLGLSWVLFDFGQRSASLQAARYTLTAAMAAQGSTVLTAVNAMVLTYGEAVTASAALEAATEALNAAGQTAAAAQARYDAKVGNQIEWLQAQTALAQAQLARVRARGVWENARAALALSLGAAPSQALQLSDWETWGQATPPPDNLDRLNQEALEQHPRLKDVKAQVAALEARLRVVSGASQGSVSISASAGTSKNWGAAGEGILPTTNGAIVASFPLFNGRETQALKAQVQAQITMRQSELEALKRDVQNQLWQAHQAVMVSQESLQASASLLISAERTFQVAQGRYKAGVGSVVEVLDAQSALADARRQRVAAQVERITSLTQLSVATGRLAPSPAVQR
jgi:outer membrane protein